MDVLGNSSHEACDHPSVKANPATLYLVLTVIPLTCSCYILIAISFYFAKKYPKSCTMVISSDPKRRLDSVTLVVSASITVSCVINIARFTFTCFHYITYASIALADIPFITIGYTGVYALIWYRVWVVIKQPFMSEYTSKAYDVFVVIVICVILASGFGNLCKCFCNIILPITICRL